MRERLLGNQRPPLHKDPFAIFLAVIIFLFAAVALYSFRYVAIHVDGKSMLNTLEDGDYLIADRWASADYGDIVGVESEVDGKPSRIKVVPECEIYRFGARNVHSGAIDVRFVPGTVEAPVAVGDVVGKFEVYENGELLKSVNALASEGCDRMSFMDIIGDIAKRW